VEKVGAGLRVSLEAAVGGDRQSVETDVLLVSVGRRPYTDGLGLDKLGVALDGRDRVVTTRNSRPISPHLRRRRLPRRGDAAHKAEASGGLRRTHRRPRRPCELTTRFRPWSTPRRKSPASADRRGLKAVGIAYKVGEFPFSANARAKTIAATEAS